jgi:hypothetical protein
MALSTFQFQATFPCTRVNLEPIGELVREIATYAGCTGRDADAIAESIQSVLSAGLADSASGEFRIRFDKDESRLRLSVSAPHLRATPPPAGSMDDVTVDREDGRTVYRYERRLPAA